MGGRKGRDSQEAVPDGVRDGKKELERICEGLSDAAWLKQWQAVCSAKTYVARTHFYGSLGTGLCPRRISAAAVRIGDRSTLERRGCVWRTSTLRNVVAPHFVGCCVASCATSNKMGIEAISNVSRRTKIEVCLLQYPNPCLLIGSC